MWYKTLQLRKECGGMGLPSLHDYYYTAQLRPPICLYASGYTARWKDIKSTSTKEIPIAAMIVYNRLKSKLADCDKPWINMLMKTCQEMVKVCNLTDSSKLLKWCAYDRVYSKQT